METFTFFWSGPFSQWHPSRFTVEGVRFTCAEQYMMYCKALLFRDRDTAAAILACSDPKRQKALGRQVQGFQEDRWNQVARQIVRIGSLAKFRQDSELGDLLRATRGTTLVEASPHDRVWGIGLSEDDPRALSRSTWRGKNWLGEVLTQVREEL